MLNDLINSVKKKSSELKAGVLKFKNKDFLSACAAGSVLIARADGDVSSEEKKKMIALITHNEALSVFDTADVIKVFNEYLGYFDFDADVGDSKACEALNKIRGDDVQCRTLMRLVIAIAAADGDFDADEKVVAKKVAAELNLNASEFNI
ncbi:MAG: tellurite resistance protein TerB [Cellvibrionaceae bacterium]|jgi:tellurite resistance protein TerB